ncbi:MAG TPA: response regulator, partial [Spirochaetia bacterium]
IRVLLVEDDEDARDLMTTVLAGAGAEVRAETTSDAAIASVAILRPHVLLCDIALSGETGYDVIRRVRALRPEDGGKVPAAAVTAYASAEDRRRATSAGFTHHLPKPIDPDGLVALVARLGGRLS